METKMRSIAKAISWRLFATTITGSIVWIFTGKWQYAAVIGIIDTSIKIVVYFFHERMWLKVTFGIARKPEYEI